MALLEINDLGVRYGAVAGTNGLTLALEEAETLALVGANGAGKSSTVRAIIGLAQYPSGDIRLRGASLKGQKPFQIVKQGIGYSPEGRRVFAPMSVIDNLWAGAFTRKREESRSRLDQIFGYFPRLKERAQQRAGSLSGGEQQMLAIGRALMARPVILLLDEPSLGLAPIVVEQIGKILQTIQRQEGLSVLLAEQNVRWALSVASNAVVIQLGKVTLSGPSQTLRNEPLVREAFLGG
jgi:branched-chain amino acid transport system ATP-binding protein